MSELTRPDVVSVDAVADFVVFDGITILSERLTTSSRAFNGAVVTGSRTFLFDIIDESVESLMFSESVCGVLS